MSSKLGNEKKNLYTNMEVRKTNDQLYSSADGKYLLRVIKSK